MQFVFHRVYIYLDKNKFTENKTVSKKQCRNLSLVFVGEREVHKIRYVLVTTTCLEENKLPQNY